MYYRSADLCCLQVSRTKTKSPSPAVPIAPLPDSPSPGRENEEILSTPSSSTSARAWSRLSSLPSRLRGKSVSAKSDAAGEEPGPGLDLHDIVESPIEDPRGRQGAKSLELTQTIPPPPPQPSSSPPLLPVHHSASLDEQSSSLIMGALDRDRGRSSRNMFGLKRATSPTTPPKPAGGSSRSAVIQPSKPVGADSGHKESRSARAPSPFFRARRNREKQRERERSPEVGPLVKDTESDGESVVDTASARGGLKKFRPQASAYDDTDVEGDDSGSDGDRGTEAEDSDDSIDEHHGDDDAESLAEDEEIFFDEETEKNTEVNAFFLEGDAAGLGGESAVPEDDGRDVLDNFGEEVEEDILGEGPNVVVPPQPLFPVANAQPAKSSTTKKGLDLTTSRPSFARDRCTINLTHGDPDDALEESGKRLRRYVVLSDMSDESRYAVEWAIGTVARDGDEIFVISVKEDESKGESVRCSL